MRHMTAKNIFRHLGMDFALWLENLIPEREVYEEKRV